MKHVNASHVTPLVSSACFMLWIALLFSLVVRALWLLNLLFRRLSVSVLVRLYNNWEETTETVGDQRDARHQEAGLKIWVREAPFCSNGPRNKTHLLRSSRLLIPVAS